MEPEKSKFKNFLKLIKFERATVAPETPVAPVKNPQDDAKTKVDALLMKAIEQRDVAKVEMILKRDFNMTDLHFYHLCHNQRDKFYQMDSNIIKPYLYKKYHRDIKYDLDERLLQYATRTEAKTDRFADLSLINNLNNAWAVIDKTKEFENKEYALEFKILIEKLEHSLREGSERQTVKDFSDILYPLKKDIERKYEEHFRQERLSERQADLLDFAQQLNAASGAFNNTETLKDHIKLGLRENINRLSVIEMPELAQAIVEEISHTAGELRPLQLNQKQQCDFDNLYTKRLPQILEEYINISPRYKEMLKSHNENPDTILLDSLGEIKTKIDEIFILVQEDNFKKQRVSNQYLKNM